MSQNFHPSVLYINWPSLEQLQHITIERYHHALRREIEQFLTHATSGRSVQAIFMGGFPDHYPIQWLLDTSGILKTICSESVEVSMEISRIVSDEELVAWNRIGVNRFVFSKCDEMKDQFIDSIRRAASICKNIALDLVLEDRDRAYYAELISLPVQHVSLYFAEGQEDAVLAALYVWLVEQLQQLGFQQYSTYDCAQSGYQSKQQLGYMHYHSYRGFGLGACSFEGNIRYQNVVDVVQYCVALESLDEQIWYEIELLSDATQQFERFMLAITAQGIAWKDIVKGCLHDNINRLADEIERLAASGLVTLKGDMVSLTPQGRLVENEIVTRIYRI